MSDYGSTPDYYVLTAAHCGGGTTGSAWEQVTTPIGTVAKTAAPSVDGMLISAAPENPASPGTSAAVNGRVLIGVTCALPQQYCGGEYVSINGAQTQDADYVGEPNCEAGITTTYLCGTETVHSETICWDQEGLSCTQYDRESSYNVEPGDSGGPVFESQQGMAMGITSGTDGNAIWQHIYDITSALGVYVNPVRAP